MKKTFFILFLALASVLVFISCKNSSPGSSATEVKSAETELYACPMHPEVQSDKPGDCPECGMALEKKEIADSTQMYNPADSANMK